MKNKIFTRAILVIVLFAASWTAGTGVLLYKLPNLIMHRLSELQIERAGALDRLYHLRTTVDYTFKDVVKPNVDTIYSSVFADLSKGPYVLEIPPIDKYYCYAFYADNTRNFKIISIRTHGPRKHIKALLVREGYQGDTFGMEVVKSPSDLVWIIARYRIESKNDEKWIHRIQDQTKFIPLSQYKEL
jgi:hypothetical protein